MYRFCLCLWVVPIALLAGIAHAARPAVLTADQQFLEAREAFRIGDVKKLERAAANLRQHVLFSYIEFYRLHLRLRDLDETVVASFLERHAGSPVAESLRLEWLRVLGKKQQWELFGKYYAQALNEDREVECLILQYRARHDPEALNEAKPLWRTGGDLPDSCSPLFAALFSQNQLGLTELRARQRLALEAGNYALIERLNAQLPASQRLEPRSLHLALRRPEQLLAKSSLKLDRDEHRELAALAIARLARSSPAAAHEFWLRFRDRLNSGDRHATLCYIAYQAARRLQSEALDWFRQGGDCALGEAALTWKVRIALRLGDWPTVLSTLATLPPSLARDSTWRYWRGRALHALGRVEEARAIWEPLADEFGYYGLLAAEELGRPLSLKSEPAPMDSAALAELAGRPAIRRMFKLYELGLRVEGTREWIGVVRGMNDEELLLAAEFARRHELFDRAINTAEKTVARHDFALRYLTPHHGPLRAAAQAHDLDEALIFALVRQESRFLPDARSRAGAVGLMQLMPPTAKWVAGKTGHRDYRPSQIGLIDVNVKFGAYYLRYVLDRLGGLPVLAAAAYNAGPSRALNWRGPLPLEGAVYVESIPFTETRDYVKKVLTNTMFYAQLLGHPHISLKERLGKIPPRDASLVGVYGVAPEINAGDAP